MKKSLLILLCIISSMAFTACFKKSGKEVPKTQPPSSVENNEEETEDEDIFKIPQGFVLSTITGEYVEEEAAKRRPFAIMINNLHKALPQSGIGQASLYYETLAEGEITRIVGIFESFDAEKIGPVRSARDYFTVFAMDNDGIFVHHGGSETGYAAIRKNGLDNIDGMNDSSFWRDKERMNIPGMYEHSSYTSAENLIESAAKHKYKMDRDIEPLFKFYDEETALGGNAVSAENITLPYSKYQKSSFIYDEENRNYKRIQSDTAQIDDLTGEVLRVKNVIIQKTGIWVIPQDDAGRRTVNLIGKGEGIFATNGKARTITWEKSDIKTPTKWFDEKGEELKINSGKTWICVFPDNMEYILE